MNIKKIKRGERLQPALLELQVGDAVEVPYRFYSENTLRVTASQLKVDRGIVIEVNCRSPKLAILTRTQ